jgi:hypothetical protein
MTRNENWTTECVECARFLAKYEAATFEQARIHNALDLALLIGDYPSTRHIKIEAYAVTARRNNARAAFAEHQEAAHRSAALIGCQNADRGGWLRRHAGGVHATG